LGLSLFGALRKRRIDLVPAYVTDTHPLLWYSTQMQRKLSRRALRIFERASRGEVLIWIPAMVIWEGALVHRLGRIRFKQPYAEWADALIAQPGFALAAMDFDVLEFSLEFEPNSDLFDVSIVATARSKDVPLITKDEAIIESEAVEVLW
jgi:PIN domain nuclease of toxin-antitoxin system